MASEKLDEKAIFNVARKIDSPDARGKYLHQVCGADQDLFERVDTLLRAYEEQASFLESPPVGSGPPTVDQPLPEQPGTTIGPYKLLQEIGEGGMGVVFMAEQSEPIERRVAVKVIKPGMDTRQVIARFEAERQALAMMDHPNIAKVFDAGSTDTGRPYFVMELVKGIAITEYCDQHQLSPRERLELFLPVCQAVQHAHQKGIIHRDIKPSNVMVAHYDDRPVPKIIDFGVAKAIEQRLTEKTVFTEFGQVVGTIEYMSPEQARLNQLDIDTRTDVYSLGVLLYELLTGETPFDGKRLRSAAFDELLRIIREEEPPRPSLRLSTSASLPSIAANRHLEPKELSALVHGELDWIVMKALEKDRARRYDTASKFAEDVQHYLNDEAVEACPPSSVYMIGKFTRRHKWWLSTAAAILVTVLVGLSVSTILIARERNAAKASAKEADRQRQQAENNLRESRAAVDRLFTRAAEELANVPHMTEVRRALLEDATEFYERFVQLKPKDPELRQEIELAYVRLGQAYWQLGRLDDAVAVTRKCMAISEELCAEFPDRIDLKRSLRDSYMSLGAYGAGDEERQYWAKALEVAEQLVQQESNNFDTRTAYIECQGSQYHLEPRTPEKEPHARRAVTLLEQLRADFPEHDSLDNFEAEERHWIGAYFEKIGKSDEAESQYRQSGLASRRLEPLRTNGAW